MLNCSSSSQFYTNAMHHHQIVSGAPPPTLHDSMILLQNLKLNATTPSSGEIPKLYHYCYVCNTQLNSCKQALLHCSGKRHRKKLTFLQSRTTATTSIDQHLPPTTTIHPPRQLIAQQPLSIQQYMSTGQQPPPAYYHHLSPALMAGTEQWLHQQQQQSTPTTSTTPYLMHPHPLVFAAAPPTPYSTSGRMLPPVSNRSSTVILPSSDPVTITDQSCRETGGRYKCETCSAGFTTGALLHSHLQSTMHYKHHAHHFHCSTTSTNGGSTIGASVDNTNGIGDGSETDSTSTSTTASIFYCSQCSIAVNSQTQLQSHHAGSRHRHRLRANAAEETTTTTAVDEVTDENAPAPPIQIRQHDSLSSSTSSIELATTHHHAGDIIVESGYTSGSGDEAALLLLRVNGLVTDPITSLYTCQLCELTLSSIVHARQHLTSPKHVQKMSTIVDATAPPVASSTRQSSFRRKSSHNNSLRNKKNTHKSATICVDADEQIDAPVVVEETADRTDINFQQSTIDLCDDDIVCNVSDSGSL